PLIDQNITYNGCEGDGYSIIINGTVYDESNPTGTEQVPGIGTCDTVFHINLTFAQNTPAMITPVNPVCTGAPIVTLTATPAGGIWSGSVSNNQFDPAAQGVGIHQVIYTFTAGSCSSADTIDITVYELTVSCMTLQNESAPGAMDGSARITVSGGIPPYTISWSGPSSGSINLAADGSFDIVNLTAGVYTVTVQDANGCTETCQFTITSNIPCTVAIDNIQTQDAACSGIDNGSATITASGGVPPYEYSLDGVNYQPGNIFSNLAPGNHTAFVRDASGCVEMLDFTIGVGPGPQLNVVEVIDASCGMTNGSIEVDASGGSLPYQFSIDGINYVFNGLFQGLGAGNYTIYLKDNALCTDTIQVPVLAAGAPVINSINVTDAACGQSNGSISIVASGGNGTLMYSINGGSSFQASPDFNGLASGSYTIVVKDDTGCQVTGTANVGALGGPTITNVTATQATCGNSDAKITITATGAPPLTYSIDGTNYQASNMFTNIGPGTYTVYVKDGNGCVANQNITVTTLNGPQITNVVATNTTCGLDNGELVITVTGGASPYEYFLNGNSYGNGGDIPDLPADTYIIDVIDDNGCSASTNATILPSESPDLDYYVTPTHCGRSDGIIELDGFDGMPPYTYSINGTNYSPIFTFPNLVSDVYTVYVKDAKGCIHEEDVFVFDVPAPTIDNVIITPPTCGMNDGTIEVTASGGTAPLTYSIGGAPQASGIFDPVAPGNYTITVTDAAGCTDTAPAVVPATPAPNIVNITVVNTQCGQSTGSLTVIANGGVAPLMYSITAPTGFQTSNVFNNLPSGTYTVTVKGANGCEDTQDATISSQGAEQSNISSSICTGDSIIIANDTFWTAGNHDILLPGGASNGCDSIIHLNLTILPLQQKTIQASICANEVFTINGIDYNVAGNYLIDTVSAVSGCDTIRHLNLTVNPLEVKNQDVTICNGSSITVNGNTYSAAGDYLIDTINAVSGCDSIWWLHLALADFNSLTITASICEGQQYVINGMIFTSPGVFTIDTIVVAGGCDTIRMLDLTVNPLPTADAGADMVLNCEFPSVTLAGTATGGTPLWTGPDINAGNQNQLTPTVSDPGTYVLTVTSPQNCTSTDTVIVTQDPNTVVADAGPNFFLSCDIDSVTLHGGPLAPNLVYQWTGPGINASNASIPDPVIMVPGLYTLIVTDTVTHCVSQPDTVFIPTIATEVIAIIQDPDQLTCFSTFIDLEATGSTVGPNIVYIWFDQSGNIIGNTATIQIDQGGMFIFVVKDTMSGCFDEDSVTVQDLIEYPPVDAGPPQVIDCNHPTVILNDGAINNLPNLIFNWTGPAGGIISDPTQLSVTVGLAGTYILTAMDTAVGCTNDDSVVVMDNSILPLADIDVVESITCLDSTALLDIGNSSSGPEFTYQWNGPGINNVNGISITPDQ
ncbi:MAG TPA: hypothetical protein VJ508_03840, partial [Saprospiraceae bacterium]|nr:hypothetical protein [Saprospiraceae bacterium]